MKQISMLRKLELMLKERFRFDFSLFLLLLIIFMSSFLRFWNLGNTPLWYSDEGVNLNLAWNLVNGRLQSFATTYSFVPHPPLFYLVSGLALKIFGYNIVVARALTAIYGVVITILMFYIGKELVNKKTGLIASFLFAVFPLAVLYNRWDFDFNLLQLLATLTLFVCIKYLKTRNRKWLVLAGVCAGAASVTSFIGISLVVGLFLLYFIDRNVKMTLKAVLIASGIFALYILAMLVLDEKFFIFSLEYALTSHGAGTPLLDKFMTLFFYSPWITLGLLGLLLYPLFFRKKKESIITMGIFFFLLLFTLQLFTIHGPHIRGVIQLFPFFALGIAFEVSFVLKVVSPIQAYFYKTLKKAKVAKLGAISLWLCVIFSLTVPLGPIVYDDFNSVITGYHTELDRLSTASPEDAYKVAAYVNDHTTVNDFVLDSPQIAWLIQCNSTTLTQAVAINHVETLFMPSNMPDDSFVYNCTYQNAKFLVSDTFSKGWTFPQNNDTRQISAYISNNWTLVYEIGEYQVYLNPAA